MDKAEFDRFADDYEAQHRANIAITGEDPDYFAAYKIRVLRDLLARHRITPSALIDFGSGIGNSLPHLRVILPDAQVTCADVSARSMDLSRARFPGPEAYAHVDGNRIPVPDAAFDAAFSSCVFHHIPHDQHGQWLGELRRVVRPGGLIVIFEHNPLNPLTVNAVRTCPFDENARLIRAGALRRAIEAAGWRDAVIDYHVFFPRALAALRSAEPYLRWLPLGAQYCVSALRA